MSYQKNINRGLDKAFERAISVSLSLSTDRIIIFSDHHKGGDDGADDFKNCADNYRAALNHYKAREYTLLILGDGEELWEYSANEVIGSYPDIFLTEKFFHDADRHMRFYGNHDNDWENPTAVKKHLRTFFRDIVVHEGVKFHVTDGNNILGTMFLVHGHQGSTFSDRLINISRPFVRYVWRPIQNITKFRSTPPAKDWRLRGKHNIAMYNWAVQKSGVLLVAGHTHKPNFPSGNQVAYFSQEYNEALSNRSAVVDEDLEEARESLAFAKAQEQPCYLNSGCCSFEDGDITGIEIETGQVRLVRWSSSTGTPVRSVLDFDDLTRFLGDAVQSDNELPTNLEQWRPDLQEFQPE
jgi:UDP-2,3-diacylglucosamine pyrophosphatase LpxH